MIYYTITLIFLVIFILFIFRRINPLILAVQVIYWPFVVIGVLSVFYIEVTGVFIIEQSRYGALNWAAFLLLIMVFLHALGVLISSKFYSAYILNYNVESKAILSATNVEVFFKYILYFLIFVLYLNVLISAPPPLIREGYIDRFSYLETTSLWFFIRFFGVICIPIPIIIGWFYFRKGLSLGFKFIFMLYILYLLLVGNKFGAYILAVFLFILPKFLDFVLQRVRLLNFKTVVFFAFFSGFIFFVIFHHYSNYSLSYQFGGPVGLMTYRLLGLQGHAFWGIVELLSYKNYYTLDLIGFFNGMQNVMLFISPHLAPNMIERGVNFAFGYFASVFLHFGYLFPLIILFFGFFHGLISILVIESFRKADFFGYFIWLNIYIMYHVFISIGSLSYIISFKLFALLILLFFYRRMQKK